MKVRILEGQNFLLNIVEKEPFLIQNSAVLFEVKTLINNSIFEEILSRVFNKHDAFQVTFTKKNNKWQQIIVPQNAKEIINLSVDIQAKNQNDALIKINEIAKELDKQLFVENEILLRACLINSPMQKTNYFLMVIHHLVCDAQSIKIIKKSIVDSYKQIISNQALVIKPNSSNSFVRWAEHIEEFSNSKYLNEEVKYWKSLPWDSINPPKWDYKNPPLVSKNYESLNFSLNRQESKILLKRLKGKNNITIHEFMLASLSSVMGSWFQSSALAIGMSTNGRMPTGRQSRSSSINTLFNSFVPLRVVGCLFTWYPIVVRIPCDVDINSLIGEVQSRVQSIPNGGVSFGILKNHKLYKDLFNSFASLVNIHIVFLPHATKRDSISKKKEDIWKFIPINIKKKRSDGPGGHIYQIFKILDNEFQITWVFSPDHHRTATIRSLGELQIQQMREYLTK